jgi:hypothetical protein
VTMDWNLWNYKSKQTFLPYKLILSGILSQSKKDDQHSHVASTKTSNTNLQYLQ